jgi:hypothetical protein
LILCHSSHATSSSESRGAEIHVLRIEHPVPNFAAWKEAFDSDPIGRERSGVRRYRVLRATDDPNYVMVDLEFDSLREAEAVQAALHELWGRVDVMHSPQARIVEVVEIKEY